MKKLLFMLLIMLPSFAFALSGLAIAAGPDAVLSWTATTHNENGLPVDDLAGYRIYTLTCDQPWVLSEPRGRGFVGTCPGVQTQTFLAEVTSTSHTQVGFLATIGQYGFGLTAFDTSDNESTSLSEVVVVSVVDNTIPNPPTNILLDIICTTGDCSIGVQ